MSSSTEIKTIIYRQLALASTAESINEVETVVEEIRSELEFKEDVYANVMVAVTEAVNNSILHGNGGDVTKKVYVEFEVPNSYRLLIRVHDEGPGFNPDDLPDPTAPQNIDKIGGRGVFLMSQLADKLTFTKDGKQAEMWFNI